MELKQRLPQIFLHINAKSNDVSYEWYTNQNESYINTKGIQQTHILTYQEQRRKSWILQISGQPFGCQLVLRPRDQHSLCTGKAQVNFEVTLSKLIKAQALERLS
jgi:hypothetical protein